MADPARRSSSPAPWHRASWSRPQSPTGADRVRPSTGTATEPDMRRRRRSPHRGHSPRPTERRRVARRVREPRRGAGRRRHPRGRHRRRGRAAARRRSRRRRAARSRRARRSHVVEQLEGQVAEQLEGEVVERLEGEVVDAQEARAQQGLDLPRHRVEHEPVRQDQAGVAVAPAGARPPSAQRGHHPGAEWRVPGPDVHEPAADGSARRTRWPRWPRWSRQDRDPADVIVVEHLAARRSDRHADARDDRHHRTAAGQVRADGAR